MPVFYLVYINEMASQLHSDDDVSAMETQVHPNLLNIQGICVATENPGKCPNAKICLLLISTGDSHMYVYLRPILPIYRYSYGMYISMLWL